MEKKTMHTTVSLLGTAPAMSVVQKGSSKASKPFPTSTTTTTTASPATTATASADVVRRVTVAEYKQAALCLAHAFADDDVARYFTHTPDNAHWSEAQRWKLHVEIMEYITYAHILKGLVLTIGEDYGCVALWMPPGENMDDYLTLLRSGLWRLHYKLTAEGRTRFFEEFFPLLHDTKHSVMGSRDEDSWYLVYIGTKATARGKGYARKLIEYVTTMADFEGRACYLESSNAVNPIIYRKLGFESVRTIELARGGVAGVKHQLEIMVREPVAEGRKTAAKGAGVKAAAEGALPPVLEKVDSMFSEPQMSVSTKFGCGEIAHTHVSLG